MTALALIFAAAFVQDLCYTAKTALVCRSRRRLAVAADTSAVLASSIYIVLAASVTIRAGLSIETIGAFAAIAVGGACGTVGGMILATTPGPQSVRASALIKFRAKVGPLWRRLAVRGRNVCLSLVASSLRSASSS